MTRLWGVIAIVLAAGCVEAELVPCGDLACPAGSVCTPAGCAPAEDAAACLDQDDRAPCTTTVITNGSCASGVCHAILCGDSLVDPGEVCDDGNGVSGDGCSGDCRSGETCGNQIVDGIAGEQCDEGIPGLSGDGCSSVCTDEVNLWLDAGTGTGPVLNGPVAAASPTGGVLVFGGATEGFATNGTWEWDGVTWQRLAPLVSPPPRVEHAMVYDSVRRRVVLFGGRDGATTLNDTWEWDGITWIQKTPATSPSPRTGMAMAYDSARQRMVLVGGFIPLTGLLGDIWEWDGTNWTERHPIFAPPAERSTLAYDLKRERSVLVSTSNIVPTYEWDGTTWTTTVAPPVIGMYSVYDPVRMTTVLLGINGSTWEWDGSAWTSRTPSLSPISPSFSNGVAYDTLRSTVVVVGDSFAVSSNVGELASAWTIVVPVVGPADTVARAYDSRRGRVVAADGITGTWEWDGRAWRRVLAPAATPPLARDPQLVYDERRGVAVLVGPLSNVMQTWEWDGRTWSRSTAQSPPFRFNFVLAYDASRGVTVLFSGRGKNDTWEWDGTTWTDKTPLVSPVDREHAGFAYDRKRQRIVMYSGFSREGLYADTWEWDGTTWTELHPTSSPGPRTLHGMTYDPRRGTVVMTGRAGDAWDWDGTTWTERVLLIPTPSDGSIAQDITGGVLLGATPSRLAYVTEVGAQETCIAAVDSDRDGLAGCADPDCWTRCAPLCVPGTPCAASDPRCGDGACGPVEDYLICPQDCTAP